MTPVLSILLLFLSISTAYSQTAELLNIRRGTPRSEIIRRIERLPGAVLTDSNRWELRYTSVTLLEVPNLSLHIRLQDGGFQGFLLWLHTPGEEAIRADSLLRRYLASRFGRGKKAEVIDIDPHSLREEDSLRTDHRLGSLEWRTRYGSYESDLFRFDRKYCFWLRYEPAEVVSLQMRKGSR